jgi:hypothetical protein
MPSNLVWDGIISTQNSKTVSSANLKLVETKSSRITFRISAKKEKRGPLFLSAPRIDF